MLPTTRASMPRDDVLIAVFLGFTGVFAVALLIWGFLNMSLDIEGAADWLGNDFFVYWSAAQYVWAGHVDRLYDIAAFTEFQLSIVDRGPDYFSPWPYPPHGLFMVLGFGALPYAKAYGLWIALTFAFYIMVATGGRIMDMRTLILAVAPSTAITIIAGQNGFLTAGLLAGGLFMLDRRPILAGIFFGLLTIKPQMGILVPIALIAAGLWRPFMAAAATAAAAIALSAAFFGIEIWQSYLEFVPQFQGKIVENQDGFINIQPTVFMAGQILGLTSTAAYALQALITLAIGAGVFVVFRNGRDRMMQAVTLMLGVPLATPYLFNYDMPVIGLAIVILTAEALKSGFLKGERLCLFLGWFLPVLVLWLNPAGLPIAPFVLAALFLMAAARALGRAPAKASDTHSTPSVHWPDPEPSTVSDRPAEGWGP